MVALRLLLPAPSSLLRALSLSPLRFALGFLDSLLRAPCSLLRALSLSPLHFALGFLDSLLRAPCSLLSRLHPETDTATRKAANTNRLGQAVLCDFPAP